MGRLSCLAFSYLINGLKEAFLEKYLLSSYCG